MCQEFFLTADRGMSMIQHTQGETHESSRVSFEDRLTDHARLPAYSALQQQGVTRGQKPQYHGVRQTENIIEERCGIGGGRVIILT